MVILQFGTSDSAKTVTIYGTGTISGGSTKNLHITAIGSNQDLNNYKTPGEYVCSGNTTVATLSNCPTGNAFNLKVEKHAGVHQRLITYPASSSFEIYIRNFYNNTWSSWYRLYGSNGGAAYAGAVSGTSLAATAGLITSTNNSNTVTIGSQNASWCHIYNSASIPFYFNRHLYDQGKQLGGGNSMSISHAGRPQVTSSTAWTKYAIPLNTETHYGDAFTYSSNGIKANRAMSCLVSATCVTFNPPVMDTEFDVQIWNSTTNTDIACMDGTTYASLLTMTIAPKMVTLAKNDVIKLRFCSGSTGKFTFIGDSNTITTLTATEI